MKYILIAVCLGLLGCSNYTEVTRMQKNSCSSSLDREKLAIFIIKCSEAANPLSDEEGEDLVAQCEKTGTRTLCPTEDLCQEKVHSFMNVQFGDWGPCK